MFFIYSIFILQIKYAFYHASNIFLLKHRLSCNKLKVFLDTNITFLCGTQFDYTIQIDNLSELEISVEDNVNFINNTNFQIDETILAKIKNSINISTSTKIIFTEFLNMSIIEQFIQNFSSSYDNILLTMDWKKYSNTNYSYCQWDQASISQNYNGIKEQFEKFTESYDWGKICLENQAYIHHVKEPPGKIVVIPVKTMMVITVLIFFLIVIILISLFFIAKRKSKSPICCCKSKKSDSSDENSDNIERLEEENLCNCQKSFFIIFILELFGIGNSAGSLISEAIGLFRTFQRVSATKTFSVHFSKECLKMFSWATNLFENIMSSFYLRDFTDIELFYLINFVIPILLVTFIVILFTNYRFYLIIILFVIPFATLGFGFAYIKFNSKIALYIIIPSLIVCIVTSIFFLNSLFDCCESLYHFNFEDNLEKFYLPFSFSIFNILIIASACLVPFFINNLYFLGSYLFICFILILISIIIDIIIGIIKGFSELGLFYIERFPVFFMNLLTLLFIPSTNYFVALMTGEYKNNWNCIIGFIIFSLVPPFLMVTMFFLDEDSDVCQKYRYNFALIEYLDIVRQIAYAFVSAYDIPWACLGIELFWLLLMVICRFYENPSEYAIQGGSSLIVIISNSIAIACEYQKKGFLSFESSILLVCAACVPAVVSLYIYFIFEFDGEGGFYNQESFSEDMSLIFILMMPFAWLFFGMIIPIIIDELKKYNKLYIM